MGRTVAYLSLLYFWNFGRLLFHYFDILLFHVSIIAMLLHPISQKLFNQIRHIFTWLQVIPQPLGSFRGLLFHQYSQTPVIRIAALARRPADLAGPCLLCAVFVTGIQC